MTDAEVMKRIVERPCNLCVHRTRCLIVDYVYSPCYETDNNGLDYHGAFELDRTPRGDEE